MCGIAGVVALADGLAPPTVDQISRMIAAQRHRGPEEFGAYRDARAALGHARLSIIDLSTGQQPLSNEDGTLWIVFNGEIFNYVELRRELLAQGHRFRTQSDTEVIVHAYEHWGVSAFERLNGQWAVAIWDTGSSRLTLARDPFGVRPLHLCHHGGRLYFASEVKGLFAGDPGIPRAFDPVGLAQTFTFWSIVPPQGVFAGVSELEPGHARTYDGDRIIDTCTWRPRFPIGDEGQFRGTPADAADATRAALEKATRLRMLRADVPVGSYLSGGLDSSLVAALGLRAKGDHFQTFSLRFEDAEYDETAYQRLMARQLGSEHHEVLVSRGDIAQVFPEVIAHTERPILRTAPAPLYLLSKLVRDAGIKVVLTGEGADEMFGGYDLFREGRVRRFWARQPASVWRPALLGRLYPYLARSPVSQQAMARQFFGRHLDRWREPGFAHGTRWQTTSALGRLFSPDIRAAVAGRDLTAEFLSTLPPDFPSWTFLAQDQYIEIRTLLSGYLLSSQGDRMLMAHSVEGRFPFLDRHVVELANSLPASFKLCGLDEKHVLKRASAGLVAPEILARKKQPYRAPDALSFVGPGAPSWIAEVMSEAALEDVGVFDARVAGQLFAKCTARGTAAQFSNADNMALVGVLSTQVLHDALIRGRAWRTLPDIPVRVIDHLPAERRP
jgi:asparagine synthase (glutamine-hydrolysing)